MNGIAIAVIAQIIIGISLIIDKTFLKEKVAGNVFAYVFWIGLFNFFAIFFVPFDFTMPSFLTAVTAFAGGVLFLIALICYYKALENGEASQTLALLGGFTPLATIIFSSLVLRNFLNPIEIFFFIFLTIGGFLMFLADRKKFRNTIFWILLAAASFALVNVFQKIAYNESSFLTSFGIMKFGTFMSAVAMLAVKDWRKKIFQRSKATPNRSKALYLGNRAMAGVASVMLSYAIKLSHPALIESTSGVKYVIIFLASLALAAWRPNILKENFRRWVLVAKIFATLLIALSVSGLMIQKYYEEKPKQSFADMSWGVTFSQKMSESFGMDWRQNYLAIVDELKPKGIRLIAYWDLIEPEKGKWQFDDLDWQVGEAEKRKIPVIITIGQKVPRWPECYFPAWVDITNLEKRQNNLLNYNAELVKRYRDKSNLLYWQVENEPYLPFGICPKINRKSLNEEISLVRKLDPSHPVLLTDGGEWGKWYSQFVDSDIFGSTLYRKVYKKRVGSAHPPVTPEYYEFKRSMLATLTGEDDHPLIISELGLEPWWNEPVYALSDKKQQELFSNQEFNEITDFARRTNIKTVYMWGVEWWYYQKMNGSDSYWNQAKDLISKGK
ncbi:MAG: DMT family transporter [bacterium]|nr:DMT family transporter [bacterium]